ncbi:MFS general substrate transporter [Cubamyces sp. BRFM 1775]|nr:MFS general substrate transporter [Cubamyces sp. BRFM 1775]
MSATEPKTVHPSASSSTINAAGSTGRVGDEDEKKSIDQEKTAVRGEVENVDPSEAQHGEHPDGGLRAWLAVIGCAAGACATFGFVNAWGVFQAYYEEEILAGTSPSTIAWIGSIQYALIFLPGLIVGRIFDMGWTKTPLGVASAVIVAVTFLTAECTKYWQFFLCQGVALGLACGVIFGVVMGCPAHWFKRRLGFALGIMALGSSLGGTCFPIAVRNLVQTVGFKWAMRIIGFIEIALLSFQFATVERRLPPRKHSGPFIDFSAFKSLQFTLYCCSSFLAFLGIYTVLTYIDVSAASEGIDPNFSFYLLAIANACSAVGRLSGGLLADRIGPLTVMTPATFVAGILTYAWPFATSVGGNIAIAIVYGCASGVYVSLLAAPVVRMGNTQDVGVRVGMSMTVVAVGAVAGPPISGAINAATGGFKYTGIYAGTTVMIACCFLIATRVAILGGLRGKC